MEQLIEFLSHHTIIYMVVGVIVFDLFIGCLRAVKEHRANSTIGIDGAIRKVAMLGCIVFLLVFDYCVKVNFIGWLPDTVLSYLKVINIESVGSSDVFGIMFGAFELLSIVKNWALLGLPMFKGVNDRLNDFLTTFTDEMPETHKNE